jgi:hypothetical protein
MSDAPLVLEYDGPRSIRAGSLTRFVFACRATARIHAGARIGVAHRWPSDWGIGQSSDAGGVDYLEVRASGGKDVRWWNARLHAWHPFDHIVFVELPDGLGPGEQVVVCYGGDAGFRAQTFIEEASPFSLRYQATVEDEWIEFGRQTIEILGGDPERLVITVPSKVQAGAAFEIHVRLEDRWGNPAGASHEIELRGPIDTRVHVGKKGFSLVEASIRSPGTFRIEGSSRTLRAVSNAVDVLASPPAHRVFFGDLHAQSIIGCGARSIDAYYSHARDFAATDFASHQANCFLVSNPEWEETQHATAKYNVPGDFVTLLGVEWSGASNVGGDHNVYFPGDTAELRRCSHEFVADKSDLAGDLPHVDDLYAHYRGKNALIAVHVGGRTADLRYHEPSLDRLLEVHSTHATSEWFLFDALRRGYKMGIVAGSDSVDGRPGNSHPGHMGVRNVRGGLTAVIAPELTRAALWDALAKRRCYATTGERILLEVFAGEATMGENLEATKPPSFDVRVEGTAPLESIELFRGTEVVQRVDRFADAAPSSRVRIAWRGATAPGNWQRARMSWDGELRVSGASILRVEGYAFDTPDECLLTSEPQRVAWRSITAGDWDGIVIDLDAPDRAELLFATEPMSIRTSLHGLGMTVRCFDASSPERSLEIRRLPRTMPPPSFAVRLSDPAAPQGEHAYWIRIRQADGAYAWSTPIYTTMRGGNRG